MQSASDFGDFVSQTPHRGFARRHHRRTSTHRFPLEPIKGLLSPDHVDYNRPLK